MVPSRPQPGLIPLAAATSLLPPAILVGWHLLRPGHDAADLPVLALALALAGFGVGLILHGRARAATAQVRDELASAPESCGADSRPIASGEASSREFSEAPDTGEEALSTSAMRRAAEVQALLDTLMIGVCLIDRRGRITVSNRCFAAILGCVEATAASGESIGELLAQSVRPDDPENGYDDRLESLGLIQALRGRPSGREWQRGDGTVIESAWTPVADMGAALVVSDLTRRRQTETALREAKEIAEATTRTKSEFLA
ncbi:MAG: hypothetical protein HOK81_05890, partial [Rhodospirillaceae bacterium]|nr:hypothetical protein [Rhodospirillaceae bacterium]